MNDINAIFEKVKAQALTLRIPFSTKIAPNVEINYRAVRRFGMCRKTGETFTIEIAAVLLSANEFFVAQTLAHELLHTCRGCQNHGVLWQNYANLLNQSYGYHISRTSSYEKAGIDTPKQNAPYRMQCIQCGVVIERYRMSSFIKQPQKYRCRCGGKWKRIL